MEGVPDPAPMPGGSAGFRLDDLTPGAVVRGLRPDGLVTVVSTHRYGLNAAEVTFRDAEGRLEQQLLYDADLPRLALAETGRPWAFDGDGARFRLVAEANRIRLAHLFDPHLAVHTSVVDPLPHQITAVYEQMLPRHPLRFLLADDPGAGKTIMAGLLIKELIARGDLRRCLVVCPGSLAEQWQDELYRRFGLPFEILTNDKLAAARTGNWFTEADLVIARLDKLSRNEDVQGKLQAPDAAWDLVICDEAHKMSAAYFGGEIQYTRRYRLGQLLSGVTRHFLLMSATPHNGKEEDFQLFMALLDGDRFEGRFRDGVHVADTSDLMRRMVKEELLTFEGTPLFPERIAYTVNYALSPREAALYAAVTDYVREEFNRAEALQNEGRSGTVGFALTILQRRLASSPEAIYQSLRRRRERLERRLAETELLARGGATPAVGRDLPILDAELADDLDEAPEDELARAEEEILDQATAARTIAELRTEIDTLVRLETLARQVRDSGEDRKWRELASLLGEIFTPAAIRGVGEPPPAGPYGAGSIAPPPGSPAEKLVLFTEHRDTLTYLHERIVRLLGDPDAVVTIHGGMGREERLKAQELFRHGEQVRVLIATDAAGEGINLQRAHLMVNYDLPWNPNRLEQRFGRIHRIGQKQVCHLWNLVANETREGDVYQTLFGKLEEARTALGGRVFDVLGKVAFDGRPLRELLIEAIRYGERPDVRARITQVVEGALDRAAIQGLLEERQLVHDLMDTSRVRGIRAEMERAEARRLQPHYVEQLFLAAFARLGGTLRPREPHRYQVTHVPAPVRARDRLIGTGAPVLPSYERIAFDKSLVTPDGQVPAAFITPGHPLLSSVLDLVLEQDRDLLRRGTILVDETDAGTEPRVLFFLRHAITDGSRTVAGERRTISERVLHVEVGADRSIRHAAYAPYLDYRPLRADEPDPAAILADPACAWVARDLEQVAVAHAIGHAVPEHLEEVRSRKLALVAATEAAVRDRLTKEINYWDHRSQELLAAERAGKANAKQSSGQAAARADELHARLRARLDELAREREIAPLPPTVTGGLLVVPIGLLVRLGAVPPVALQAIRDTQASAAIARAAVMEAERRLGYVPVDVELEKRGYDIESVDPRTGHLRMLEVKGRVAGADTITVTKNEVLTSFNRADQWILALVEHRDPEPPRVRYLRSPFVGRGITADFDGASIDFPFAPLLARAGDPA